MGVGWPLADCEDDSGDLGGWGEDLVVMGSNTEHEPLLPAKPGVGAGMQLALVQHAECSRAWMSIRINIKQGGKKHRGENKVRRRMQHTSSGRSVLGDLNFRGRNWRGGARCRQAERVQVRIALDKVGREKNGVVRSQVQLQMTSCWHCIRFL